MAMTKCPDCGQDVSDKARKCIHCGKVFAEEEVVREELKCSECGNVLSIKEEICPRCGAPVERSIVEATIKPQAVEVLSIKVADKTKKIIIGVIIALVICIASGAGYKIYAGNKAEQEYQIAYNTYIDNLTKVQVIMLSGGSDAEKLCNLTLQVWGNTIYEERDSETDQYTRPDGYFVSDFNTAITNLFSDSDTKTTISNIEDNQKSAKEIVKNLQDIPDGLDKSYDTVSDLYEAYKTLTDLAINPSGNYNGYSDKKSSAVSDFISSYDKLDSQIPEKISDK